MTDISKYCQTCWRNARLPADRWQDCTQAVFVRLLERVEADKWGTVLVDDHTQNTESKRMIRFFLCLSLVGVVGNALLSLWRKRRLQRTGEMAV